MTEPLTEPSTLTRQERDAVQAELFTLADDEFVIAERYTEWQVRGPTLEADIAIANIAQDELGHARLWYDLLEDFGYDETELLWHRPASDFKHAPLVELAVETGDWADCILRGFLYDTAESLRLEALSNSTYERITDRVGKVRGEEVYHIDHAQNWLERLTEHKQGRERIQRAVDRLYPYALTLFEPTPHESDIVTLGIRQDPVTHLREDWVDRVTPFLTALEITVPTNPIPELLPDVRGRDGTHTPDWDSLHDDFTSTYRLLDRTEAARLMPDPDEPNV